MQQKTEKTQNPFVVEIESDGNNNQPKVVSSQHKTRDTEDKAKVVAKEVVKPSEKVDVILTEPSPKNIETIVGISQKKSSKQWGMFFVGVVTTLVVVLISGGLWWGYRNRAGMTSVTPSPTPEMIAAATPDPTPIVVEIDRSVILVNVLNASGVTGKAGTVARELTELGYKKTTAGNAAAQVGSTISFSEDIASLSATVLADIQQIVPTITVSEKSVPGTSEIRLVLGSE